MGRRRFYPPSGTHGTDLEPWGFTAGPRTVGGIVSHPPMAVVHSVQIGLVARGATAHTEYTLYLCMWLLLLSLSLALFPMSLHRTALSAPSPESSWRWPLESPIE